MSKMKKCNACSREFLTKSNRRKICEECIQISNLSDWSIWAVERAREEYNKRHGTLLTYGKFVCLIENINKKRRRKK